MADTAVSYVDTSDVLARIPESQDIEPSELQNIIAQETAVINRYLIVQPTDGDISEIFLEPIRLLTLAYTPSTIKSIVNVRNGTTVDTDSYIIHGHNVIAMFSWPPIVSVTYNMQDYDGIMQIIKGVIVDLIAIDLRDPTITSEELGKYSTTLRDLQQERNKILARLPRVIRFSVPTVSMYTPTTLPIETYNQNF